jgi:hypothetical protein
MLSLLRELWRHWFRLPTPIDLGWSDRDALGLRQLTPYQEGRTWEDWAAHVRAHYPVRYFLNEVLPLWLKSWFVWPLERCWAWLLDHLVPSRRYHLLDLRGVDPIDRYQHGYIDPCDQFRIAGWASLMRWYREGGHDSETSDELRSKQHSEALDLVHYWTVTRLEREARCNQLRAAVTAIPTTADNRERYEAASDAWYCYFRENGQLDEAMWLRLAALRPYLWS